MVPSTIEWLQWTRPVDSQTQPVVISQVLEHVGGMNIHGSDMVVSRIPHNHFFDLYSKSWHSASY